MSRHNHKRSLNLTHNGLVLLIYGFTTALFYFFFVFNVQQCFFNLPRGEYDLALWHRNFLQEILDIHPQGHIRCPSPKYENCFFNIIVHLVSSWAMNTNDGNRIIFFILFCNYLKLLYLAVSINIIKAIFISWTWDT